MWTRSYAAGEFLYRLAVDDAGDVVAVGAAGTYLGWVTLKVGPGGVRRWSRQYSATEGDDEIPSFVAIDDANAIYVTGRVGPIPDEIGISLLMMTTVKYEPGGTLAWVVNKDINRGQRSRRNRSGRHVLGQGQMLTVRYGQT